MSIEHVSHADLLRFAKKKVNLPEEKKNEYREQAKRLQDKLVKYLEDSPDFSLRRMITSGSLAKGTALKSINDIDVGCYITGVDTSTDIPTLLNYLVEKLQKAFPNFTPDQVKPQTYCVTVSFKGTGLDVDIVPIIYDGNKDWDGYLVSQKNGELLLTNIPKHLEFIRKRKSENKIHFAQVVRLIKYWVIKQKEENENFRFKSFMVELVLAKLSDRGTDFSNYIEAMQSFFTYVATTNIKELIAFDDYYNSSALLSYSEPVKIIDPVNPENNAAKLYTENNADLIATAAIEAGDSIDSALYATTKEKTIYYWQKIFGPSFSL